MHPVGFAGKFIFNAHHTPQATAALQTASQQNAQGNAPITVFSYPVDEDTFQIATSIQRLNPQPSNSDRGILHPDFLKRRELLRFDSLLQKILTEQKIPFQYSDAPASLGDKLAHVGIYSLNKVFGSVRQNHLPNNTPLFRESSDQSL